MHKFYVEIFPVVVSMRVCMHIVNAMSKDVEKILFVSKSLFESVQSRITAHDGLL